MLSVINRNFKANMICHSMLKKKGIIDLKHCNYGCLLSDSSSKEQSPMTIIHHKVVVMQYIPKMNELKANWDDDIVNLFIKNVIREFTKVT